MGSLSGVKVGSGGAGPVTKRLYQEFSKVVLRPEEGTPAYEAESVSV